MTMKSSCYKEAQCLTNEYLEKKIFIYRIYSTTLCPDILYKADFILAVVGQVSDGHVAHWPVIFNYYNL